MTAMENTMKQPGFTLLELCIALLICSGLLGLQNLFAEQMRQVRYTEIMTNFMIQNYNFLQLWSNCSACFCPDGLWRVWFSEGQHLSHYQAELSLKVDHCWLRQSSRTVNGETISAAWPLP